MKIAVSSSGNGLNAQIDPRFGRCAFFLIIDPETMTFEAFDNENIALGGGAGIQSAQFVASKGVKAVITGNCGPNAVRTLTAAGIELVLGQSGTVRDAVEAFRQGNLSVSTEPNVSDHYGAAASATGRGCGRGMGGGMGRGMGGGMGRGGGRCRPSAPGDLSGAGTGANPGGPARVVSGQSSDPADGDALEGLKARAEALRREIEALEARIQAAKAE